LWCICGLLLQEVQQGIPPQAALSVMSQQLEEAGGSFKKLRKQQQLTAAAAAAMTPAVSRALPGQLVSECSSSHNNAAVKEVLGGCSGKSIAAHPLMSISALDVKET
jgi:hypothetical protein